MAYRFKSWRELQADAAATAELNAILAEIRGQNAGRGNVVNGYPSPVSPSRSFRFEMYNRHEGPEDAFMKIYILNQDNGRVTANPNRGGLEIFVRPELEERILRFLTGPARVRDEHLVRRHAYAGFARLNPVAGAGAVPAPAAGANAPAAAGAGVGGRRRRTTRRKARKTRKGTRRGRPRRH